MNHHHRSVVIGVLALTVAFIFDVPVQGAPPTNQATAQKGDAVRTPEQMSADLTRLQAEIREQRQLLMQLMRVEQQHYELLLGLAQSGRGDGAGPGATGAVLPRPTALGGEPGGLNADKAAAGLMHRPAPTGVVRGRVLFPGGSLKDAYVYVDNIKGAAVRGRSVDIVQRDKQFIPEVTVVQRGTRVSFPNYDSVFHNVFSSTPPHPFDLGSHRAGEPAKSIELNTPGVIDIFCNVHSRMRASVLVVPSAAFTRVGADGQFRLESVPLGARKIVIWSPSSKPVEQTIEVGSSGADITMSLEAQAQVAHNNKFGQPYPSYKE
jgi:plastocyanin